MYIPLLFQNTISIALSPSLEGNKDEIGEMPNMVRINLQLNFKRTL